MDALVMCGGRGRRLDAGPEKPLYEIAGRPMVDRVLDALAGSRVDRTYPAVSPRAPETRDHLVDRLGADYLVSTPGEGYVADLGTALGDDRLAPPVLTVVADLPLLAPAVVDRTVARYDGRDLTVCVPVSLKRALGTSVDTTRTSGGRALAPAGLNVVGEDDDERVVVSYDARLAVNVNRPGDADLAAALVDARDAASPPATAGSADTGTAAGTDPDTPGVSDGP